MTDPTRLRPPIEDLRQLGKDWADRMNYRMYANGKLKTKHGTIFRNAEEVGRFCVEAGLVAKQGKHYFLTNQQGLS